MLAGGLEATICDLQFFSSDLERLKSEVLRKAFDIASYGLVKDLRRSRVQGGQVKIQHDFLSTYHVDQRFDRPRRNRGLFARSGPSQRRAFLVEPQR
jgi:hypothetical protein